MNALSLSVMNRGAYHAVSHQIKKLGPLGITILLHLAFFYALQSGLIKQVIGVMNKEVFVTFITPEKSPEPVKPKAPPLPPKQVPIVKKSVPPPPVPVTSAPAPTAISAPPSPPQSESAEPTVAEAAPVAASPPGPALPKPITSAIEYIEPPRVNYPAASKRMREEDVIHFSVMVNTQGKAEKVDIIKSAGFSRLEDEVRRAVMLSRFKPYIENGKAIAISAKGSIRFKLDN